MAITEKTKDGEERSYEGIPPKVEKVSEELMCKLNDVEWNNRSNELAEAVVKSEELEIHRKNVMADLGADVKTAKAKVSKLSNIVSTRAELREVTVEVTYDYETGFLIKRRTDTNEEISRRELTTSERQSGLFDHEDRATDANDFIESRHDDEAPTDTAAETESEGVERPADETSAEPNNNDSEEE